MNILYYVLARYYFVGKCDAAALSEIPDHQMIDLLAPSRSRVSDNSGTGRLRNSGPEVRGLVKLLARLIHIQKTI